MARTRKARARRPPKVAFTLLTHESHRDLYVRLHDLVAAHHEELLDARIALAWCTSWRLDIDGKQTLGRCKRATDLDRELMEFDFVILLNREWCEHQDTTAIQRDALLDHELCHATTRDDPDTGKPMKDERGRICYRLRKHDLEEFVAIGKRYGIWKRDIELFARGLAQATARGQRLPIDDDPTEPPLPPQASGNVH